MQLNISDKLFQIVAVRKSTTASMDAVRLIPNVVTSESNVSEANTLQKDELAEFCSDRMGNKQKGNNNERMQKMKHENGKDVKISNLVTQVIKAKRMDEAKESIDSMKCEGKRGFSKQMASDLQDLAINGLRKGDITDISKKINERSKLHNWKKVCSKLTGKAR